jgi:hypothetical protein
VQAEQNNDYAGHNREGVFVLRRDLANLGEMAPRVMNTTLKPRMNPIEFVMTRRIRRPCDDFSSSTPAPEIRETISRNQRKHAGREK